MPKVPARIQVVAAGTVKHSMKTHRVKKGDTLSHIARLYNVSVEILAQTNNIKNINKIRAGQELVIEADSDLGAARAATTALADPYAERAAQRLLAGGLDADKRVEQSAAQTSKLARRDQVPRDDSRHDKARALSLTDLLKANKPQSQASRDVGLPVALAGTEGVNSTNPISSDLAAQLSKGLAGLSPNMPTRGDALTLLGAVDNGDVSVRVPMTPGTYKQGKISYKIEPGTTMEVHLQVRDGQLVPARNTDGDATSGGCRVEIKPPLDLPLWLRGDGVYLKGDQAQAQLKYDIGGLFDLRMQKLASNDLKSIMRELQKSPLETGSSTTTSNLPLQQLQLNKMQFDVGDVNFKQGNVDVGNAKIQLGPDNKLSISGQPGHLLLRGHVDVQGLGLEGNKTQLRAQGIAADIRAEMHAHDDGSVDVNTSLQQITGDIQSLHSGAKGATADNLLAIGKARIEHGALVLQSQYAPDANGVLQERRSSVDLKLPVTGTLQGFQLFVQDAKDDACIRVEKGEVKGLVEFNGKDIRVDGSIKNTTFAIDDVQSANDKSSLDLQYLHASGDLAIKADSASGIFHVDLDAKSLDLKLLDYTSHKDGIDADLGETSASGSGQVAIDSVRGLDMKGDFNVSMEIDDLKTGVKNGVGVDVAKRSKLSGKLSRFASNSADGLILDGKGRIDIGLEGYAVDLPGLSARGAAQVHGSGEFSVSKAGFRLLNADAKLDVDIDDAQVAPGGAGFELDAAQGGSLGLSIQELSVPSDGSARVIRLGPGSLLDATLDGGKIDVNGVGVPLERGSRARFVIDELDTNGEVPQLKGSLQIDTHIAQSVLANKLISENAYVSIQKPTDARAAARIVVDDVTLRGDGSFSIAAAHADLQTKVASFEGVSHVGVDSNISANRTLRQSRGASELPASTFDRNEASSALGAPVSPSGTLDIQSVKSKSAAEIAGMSTAAGVNNFDAFELAKRVKNGVIDMTIPLEGTLGSGLANAHFGPGTTLHVQAKVVDGKVVFDATKAELSDKAKWFGLVPIPVDGIYFDKNNEPRLDLDMLPDPALGETALSTASDMDGFDVTGLELPDFQPRDKLSNDVPAFVDRLKGLVPKPNNKTNLPAHRPLDLVQAKGFEVNIKNAELLEGNLDLPGGSVYLQPGNMVNITGSHAAGSMSGRVRMRDVQLVQDGVAIKADKGEADLDISWSNQARSGEVQATLNNLNLDLQFAVSKRANGDYIHLADGALEKGRLHFSTKYALDAKGLPSERLESTVNFDANHFIGKVNGGRVTVKDKDGTAQVEMGSSQISGRICVDHNQITMLAHAANIDVVGRNMDFDASSGGQTRNAKVEYMRFQGDSLIDISPERGFTINTDFKNLDLRASDTKSYGSKGINVDTGAVIVVGSGKATLSSKGELEVTGDLHVDAKLDSGLYEKQALGKTVKVRADADSRFKGDVNRVWLSKTGAFRIQGEGGIDLGVKSFESEMPGMRAKGSARLHGKGDFSIDSESGVSLPKSLIVDIDAKEGTFDLPGGGGSFALADGAKLHLNILGMGMGEKGVPDSVELGVGTRISGALNSGEMQLPGMQHPIKVTEGSNIDFQIEQMLVGKSGAKRAAGRLHLDAAVDLRQVDLRAFKAMSGVSIQHVDKALGRLVIDIAHAELREDGSFVIQDSEIKFAAQLKNINGHFQMPKQGDS